MKSNTMMQLQICFLVLQTFLEVRADLNVEKITVNTLFHRFHSLL